MMLNMMREGNNTVRRGVQVGRWSALLEVTKRIAEKSKRTGVPVANPLVPIGHCGVLGCVPRG